MSFLVMGLNHAKRQMTYGHTLHTVGQLDEAVEAYRKCTRLSFEAGEAYWSMANLVITVAVY